MSEDDLGCKQGLKSLKLFVVKIAKLELFEAVPEKGQQINITLTEMLTMSSLPSEKSTSTSE